MAKSPKIQHFQKPNDFNEPKNPNDLKGSKNPNDYKELLATIKIFNKNNNCRKAFGEEDGMLILWSKQGREASI